MFFFSDIKVLEKSKSCKHDNKGSFIQSDDNGYVTSLFKSCFEKKALAELSYEIKSNIKHK